MNARGKCHKKRRIRVLFLVLGLENGSDSSACLRTDWTPQSSSSLTAGVGFCFLSQTQETNCSFFLPVMCSPPH